MWAAVTYYTRNNIVSKKRKRRSNESCLSYASPLRVPAPLILCNIRKAAIWDEFAPGQGVWGQTVSQPWSCSSIDLLSVWRKGRPRLNGPSFRALWHTFLIFSNRSENIKMRFEFALVQGVWGRRQSALILAFSWPVVTMKEREVSPKWSIF